MRSGTSRAERFEERRTQLAQSALETLGELGYARTSLREIAQNSEFTHGVVHYYFADKVELITHCVRLYKTQCVNRFDEIVLDLPHRRRSCSSGSPLRLVETDDDRGVRCTGSGTTCATQSMFEDAFRDDVLDIDATLQGHDLARGRAVRRAGRRHAPARRAGDVRALRRLVREGPAAPPGRPGRRLRPTWSPASAGCCRASSRSTSDPPVWAEPDREPPARARYADPMTSRSLLLGQPR